MPTVVASRPFHDRAVARPPRAPAVHVAATREDGSALSFRLPQPPGWQGCPPRAWAAERRARKAYFAALDALATGVVHTEQVLKVRRFAVEVRATAAHRTLEHLLRILGTVRREGRPLLERPRTALRTLTVTVDGPADVAPEALARRYALALEWLRTRGWMAGKGVTVTWQVADAERHVA